jgi:hypothetical protein
MRGCGGERRRAPLIRSAPGSRTDGHLPRAARSAAAGQ